MTHSGRDCCRRAANCSRTTADTSRADRRAGRVDDFVLHADDVVAAREGLGLHELDAAQHRRRELHVELLLAVLARAIRPEPASSRWGGPAPEPPTGGISRSRSTYSGHRSRRPTDVAFARRRLGLAMPTREDVIEAHRLGLLVLLQHFDAYQRAALAVDVAFNRSVLIVTRSPRPAAPEAAGATGAAPARAGCDSVGVPLVAARAPAPEAAVFAPSGSRRGLARVPQPASRSGTVHREHHPPCATHIGHEEIVVGRGRLKTKRHADTARRLLARIMPPRRKECIASTL